MRRIDFYRVKRRDNLGDPDFWNKRLEDIDLRLAANEQKLTLIDQVAARSEAAALSRINDVLTPLAAEAQDRLTRVATLFEATSDSEVTLSEGPKQFIIPVGQRLTFAPLAYVIAFPTGDLSRYMTGRVESYNHNSGVLQLDAMRAAGEGTFSDWQITPMAFASELEVLASDVSADAQAVSEDRAAVLGFRNAAQDARDEAVSARVGSEAARDLTQARYTSFSEMYRGPLSEDPSDGFEGAFYFNTSQQMARIRGALTWAPMFSISLGGIRQGEIVATAAQTVLVVGDFTFMNIWKDGVKLRPGVDFTLSSPNVTLTTPATGGEVFSYLGYYGTDATDFYTKAQADAAFYPRSLANETFYSIVAANAAFYSRASIDETVDGLNTAIEGKQAASSTLTLWASIDPASKANVTATNLKWQGAGFTVSTAAPSGGADGDFWFRREA